MKNEYLFVADLAAFRRKMKRLSPTAGRIWRSLEVLPNAGGNERYSAAFRYLVTGKEPYAKEALGQIRKAMEFYLAGELSMDVQFHTWCNAAPMARLATMLDWIADSRSVSARDFAQIKEAMLDYTFKHPFNISKSRVCTFDNQIASMAFCCTLVGYLFGVKRGSDPRAQRMLESGAMRFSDIFGLSPRGGYSYEGSTYFCQVVTPVVSWYCALMEQVTGQEYFNYPFPPSGTSPREILQTYAKIIGPTGLMPPWDHYGWQRCSSTMGLAYLAARTGEAAPLRMIERLSLAAEPNQIAWGTDDKIWTLIWWPEETEAPGQLALTPSPSKGRGITAPAGETFTSWAIDNVAGALVDEGKQWRLFQAWDRCAPSVYCGRCQVNPNMVSLDLWGSPVFTDGIPDKDCTHFDYPLEAFKDTLKEGEFESITNYHRTFIPNWDPKNFVKGFGYGLVGGSNSIVVNGEGHWSPPESREGRLTAFASLPNFKLLASEAAMFYRPRYPIESMVRTSVLVRNDYMVLSDAVSTSGKSLRFDWQVFTRGQVTRDGGRVNIVTAEGVELDVLPMVPGLTPRLTPVAGFPRGLEGRSTLIQYGTEGSRVTLPFLLVPHRQVRPVLDLSNDWKAARVDEASAGAAALPPGAALKSMPTAADCGLLPSADGNDDYVWACREFKVPPACRGKRVFLHFFSPVNCLKTWVNGGATAAADMPPAAQYGGDWYAPTVIEITSLLRKGVNRLVIAGKTFQGKLVNGPVELMVETPKPALPEVRALGEGHYEIAGPFGRDELILSGGGEIHTERFSGRCEALLVSQDGSFAALRATRLVLGEVEFWSDRPIDVACQDGQVTLGEMSGPDLVELRGRDFGLRVQSRGVMAVDLWGDRRPRIVTRLAHDKPIFCNGRLLPAVRDAREGTVVIAPGLSKLTTPSDKALPPYVRRMEDLMRAASAGGAKATAKLIAALGDGDWKVQQVAAELLGKMGVAEAAGPLLALLAEQTPEKIYQHEFVGWGEAFKKYQAEGAGPFLAGSGSSADVVNRHRLKAVVIEALGRLRAKQAVAPLCRIVEDQREFYPVHSVACVALGQIGERSALVALGKAAGYAEINTKYRALDAIARLTQGHPACPDYPDRAQD